MLGRARKRNRRRLEACGEAWQGIRRRGQPRGRRRGTEPAPLRRVHRFSPLLAPFHLAFGRTSGGHDRAQGGLCHMRLACAVLVVPQREVVDVKLDHHIN